MTCYLEKGNYGMTNSPTVVLNVTGNLPQQEQKYFSLHVINRICVYVLATDGIQHIAIMGQVMDQGSMHMNCDGTSLDGENSSHKIKTCV